MNIEKLAKHLKEFTLDEIEMIAECDCEKELSKLIQDNILILDDGVYKYNKKQNLNSPQYGIFMSAENHKDINISSATDYFLANYVQKKCKKETIHQYKTIIKMHILPYFQNTKLKNITNNEIKNFYLNCKIREVPQRRIKNILALLKQILKYYQNLGYISRICNFQVRRITHKNEFDISRIIFEE